MKMTWIVVILMSAFAAGAEGRVKYSETLEELTTKYRNIVGDVLKQLMPLVLQATSEARLSSNCTHAFFQVILGFRQLEEWAVALVDASGKLQSGAFDGAVSDFGEYDQCLAVTAMQPNFAGQMTERFRGQYCLVEASPPPILALPPSYRTDLRNDSIYQELKTSKTIFRRVLHLQSGIRINLRQGLCVPSKCSVEDVGRIAQMAADFLEMKTKVLSCETRTNFRWKSEQLAIVEILGILVFLAVIGTIVELWTFRRKENAKELPHRKTDFCVTLWKSFSVIQNTDRLQKGESDLKELSSLHGIRFLTVCWIVLAHTYFFPYLAFFYRFKRQYVKVAGSEDNLIFGLLANPSPAIDSLFVMSGLLVCYESGRSKKGLGLWMIFVRRVLRTFPMLVLTILLFMLLPLIGDGPQWDDLVNKNINVCRYNWWKSLLFVQNFWKFEDNCMMHTWFLSLVIQYSLLSIFLVWLLYNKLFFGLLLNFGAIVGSAVYIGYTNMFNKFPPSLKVVDMSLFEEVMDKDYLRTYAHVGPFCVGLVAGYLLNKIEKYRMKSVFQWIGWILCSAFIIIVLLGLYKLDETHPHYVPLAAVYAALYRPLWALSIAWICVICATGQAGTLQKFLSWKRFIKVDRLSNFLYLLHPLFIFYYTGQGRERISLGHTEMIMHFVANIVITVLISFVCYVVLLPPFHYLDMLLFEKNKSKKTEEIAEVKKEITDPEMIINIYRSNTLASLNSEAPSRQPDAAPRQRKRSTVSFKSQTLVMNVDDPSTQPGPSTPTEQTKPKSVLRRMDSVFEEREKEAVELENFSSEQNPVSMLASQEEEERTVDSHEDTVRTVPPPSTD